MNSSAKIKFYNTRLYLVLLLGFLFFHVSHAQQIVYLDSANFGLPSSQLRDLAIDSNTQDIWITTNDRGVLHYDWNQWHVYDTSNSPAFLSNDFNSVAIDYNTNSVWATASDAVYQFQNNVWTRQSFNLYDPSGNQLPLYPSYYQIEVNDLSEIWIVTGCGLVRHDTTGWAILFPDSARYSDTTNYMRCLAHPDDGYHPSDIDFWDNKTWSTGYWNPRYSISGGVWQQEPPYSLDHVGELCFEPDGDIWLANVDCGTDCSIYKVSSGNIYHYSDTVTGINRTTWDMQIDKRGTLWASTSGRFTFYDGSSWHPTIIDTTYYSQVYIYDFNFDDYGNTWMIVDRPFTPKQGASTISTLAVFNPVKVSGPVASVPTGEAPSASRITSNIFPNPSHGEITIQIDGAIGSHEVEIISLLGQTVYRQTFNSNTYTIRDLEPGIYDVRLSNQEYQFNKKIVVY